MASGAGGAAASAAAVDVPTRCVHTLKGHSGAVLVTRFNRKGTYCLTGGQDRLIKLWNPSKGTLVASYKGHGHEVLDIQTTFDNAHMVSCGGDRDAFLWDVSQKEIVRRFRGHTSRINTVALNADDTVLFTGSYDRMMRAWDLRTTSGKPIQIMDDFKDSVSSVVVRDARVIAGCVDGTVRVYDVRMGSCTVDTIGEPVTSARVSRDGHCVLAACMDSAVRLIDVSTGELLNTYKGHTHKGYKTECAFTHTDAHVLCGSEDGMVYVWDLVECRIVRKLVGHAGVVSALATHPSARILLTAGVDGTARVWT